MNCEATKSEVIEMPKLKEIALNDDIIEANKKLEVMISDKFNELANIYQEHKRSNI
jgi:dephospho-CoA kinase